MAEQNKNQKEVILVTGGSGLLGSRLMDMLADSYQMIGLDKVDNPNANSKTKNYIVDITSDESVRKVLGQVKSEYGNHLASVVHLAAFYDFSTETSPKYDEITVKGTERFLNELKNQKFNIDQFVFSSTNLVYKPTEPGKKINEFMDLEPVWGYPLSKVKTEQLLSEQHGDIPLVILRLAGAYDEMGHSIPLSHQIQRIYEKRFTSYFFPGSLLSGNAFVHIADILNSFKKTIEHRNKINKELTLNISEPDTVSYDELQDEIGELLYDQEWPTFKVPKLLAKAGAWVQDLVGDPFIKPWMVDRAGDHFELDISRAKEILGWEPQHSLRDTLPKMIQNLKKDPVKWYEENKLEVSYKAEKESESKSTEKRSPKEEKKETDKK